MASKPWCGLESEFKACCCNCKYHVADFAHCTTDPLLRDAHNKCVCNLHKGYICTVREGHFHSGWGEHGMCEMHVAKNTRAKKRKGKP